jgi:hypothetical protein
LRNRPERDDEKQRTQPCRLANGHNALLLGNRGIVARPRVERQGCRDELLV